MTKTKICGLTNKDDAVWALNYGADFLGVNLFQDSPRHVTVATASKWVPTLPSFATVVGIFVDAEMKTILDAVNKLNLKGIQLHGSETVEMVRQLKSDLEATGHPVFIIKINYIGSN